MQIFLPSKWSVFPSSPKMFDAMLQNFVSSGFKVELHFRATTAMFCTHYRIPILAFIIMFPAYIYSFQFFHCTCHFLKFVSLPFSIIAFKCFFLSAKLSCLLLRHITSNLIKSPSATKPCFRRMDSSACKTVVSSS